MDVVSSFIVTCLAGAATLIGMMVLYLSKKESNDVIISSLGFAAGVMIAVSLTDLIPESFNLLRGEDIFPTVILVMIFFVIGVIISSAIDKYLPDNKTNNNNLYKIGIISMISIIIHNIPEGIITFLTSTNNVHLGITLAFAITLHNIPEGICIAVPIYYATKNKLLAFKYILISALSEPLGGIIGYFILKPVFNNSILGFFFALIAGIMIHISCYELLPTSLKYKKISKTILFFIIGFIFMILTHILLSL